MSKISILIPTYNDSCLALAKSLQSQIDSLKTTKFGIDSLKTTKFGCPNEICDIEVIIADDCSTNAEIIAENSLISSLPNCRLIRPDHNLGRAAIRNFLADNAKGKWLLFIDGDLKVKKENFLQNYINAIQEENVKVVYGGYSIEGSDQELQGNLRYKVERAAEPKKTLSARLQHPYNHFHTANFLISSDIFHSIRFNEQIKLYGFEDVLFGKQLKEAGIKIKHIDNPVYFVDFETNAEYLRKTEESIKTQQQFADLIGDYSTLIHTHRTIKNLHLTWLLTIINKCFGNKIKANILGNNPSLFAFKLYKLLKITKG